MKTMINFTTSPDDTGRYKDAEDLLSFCRRSGCSGLELMPIGEDASHLIDPALVIGIHASCLSDWINTDFSRLVAHYRKDLDYARKIHAEYVVFHVTQVTYAEALTYEITHTDEQVVKAAVRLINALLDGQDYHFYFLMENLWWPGLNFLNPEIAEYLIREIHYPKKGFMLDTGHFMNTNPKLRTSREAVAYLHDMLDRHESMIPMIKGLHLNQSLSGSYVEEYKKHPAIPPEDPDALCCRAFEHIFRVDQHLPFTDPGVPGLVRRIDPLYVTLEYITKTREEHEKYLKIGMEALAVAT